MSDRTDTNEGLDPRDFAIRMASVFTLVFGTLAVMIWF
ncbi:hypothetical protein BH23CHL5_BH23CHL5_21300 [soil metagenome]